MMLLASLVACVVTLLCFPAWAQYPPDEITELPGMFFKPNFRQWSGYLEARPGKFLHYWFVTSQSDPSNDPLVLWLNGGPGCSSMDGLLSENGPFFVNDNGATLYENKYSWNTIANVLYLEAPAGVGYSYSDDKQYQTDDDQVADDNYLALQSFFVKFPNFTQNEFYITGESYGGIYVPTLCERVVSGTAKMNLKGFAVGNALSSYALNDQSLIYFGYYHGLFGEQLWRDLNSNCCEQGNCNFYNNSAKDCQSYVYQAQGIIFQSGLNSYALYRNCEGDVSVHKEYRRSMNNLFRNYRNHWETLRQAAPSPAEATLRHVPACLNSTAQMNWLNRGDVRKALHIPDTLPKWDICSDTVGEQYGRIYQTVKEVYLKLLSLGLRVLVYNGDTDMACNFLGDQWFVEDLGQQATTPYQMWIHNQQVAGFYQQYGNITFLTVKGAGHMVPQWAPGPALQMFHSFITGRSY